MKKTALMFLFFSAILFCKEVPAFAEYDHKKEDFYVRIIVAEAANQGLAGAVAVAEVLRNRGWDTRGFCGIKRRDSARFLGRQPKRVFETARRGIRAARSGSNLTSGATHFDNIRAYGVPKWARKMKVAAQVGDHVFYRTEIGR